MSDCKPPGSSSLAVITWIFLCVTSPCNINKQQSEFQINFKCASPTFGHLETEKEGSEMQNHKWKWSLLVEGKGWFWCRAAWRKFRHWNQSAPRAAKSRPERGWMDPRWGPRKEGEQEGLINTNRNACGWCVTVKHPYCWWWSTLLLDSIIYKMARWKVTNIDEEGLL